MSKLYDEVLDLAAGLSLAGKISSTLYGMISDIEETDTAKLERTKAALVKIGGSNE